MPDPFTIDDDDRRLLHALQLSPRAPWTQLSPILGLDPTTLARRWQRLTHEGLAWTSCYAVSQREWILMPSVSCCLIEVDCHAGRREQVIEAIGDHEGVLSVECTSGSRDLLLTVVLATHLHVDRYIEQVLARTPGVRATRSHFTRQVVRDGSQWQLDALGAVEKRKIQALTTPYADTPAAPTPAHEKVLDLLSRDLRMPAVAIARSLDRSLSSTSRLIHHVLGAGWARTRVEFAHDRLGWELSTVLWFVVPHEQVTNFLDRASTLPHVRMCCTVLGRMNIAITLWLRNYAELDAAERELLRDLPEVEVADRWLITRTAKRLGHLLDADGRHVRLAEGHQGLPR